MSTAVRAFSAPRVMRLTGLTKRRLQYWDEKAFVSPSLTVRPGRGGRRLYDFRDLVALRVAAQLRDEGVSLQRIRKVTEHLRSLNYDQPLAQLRFWAVGGEVYFKESGTVRAGKHPEQLITSYSIPVGVIVNQLEADIAKLDRRPVGKVERRRATLGGKLLIAGTRIPVASVKRLHRDGADEAEILTLYPDLTAADVRAALGTEEPPRHARSQKAS
jgi:DNA-binding transcriptional MerR regulator